MNLKKTWTIAVVSLTAVVVGAVAYRVITSSDSTEEQLIVTTSQDSEEPPDTAGQSEEERQIDIQDHLVTPVSTTSTTLPEVQEPVVEEEPEEEVTEDPATGTEVDDSEEDPPTTPVSTTSTTLPEVQEPVVEEEPEEEVTEDPATGTEVDDSTEDSTVTTPVSTTSTTLPEEQEPVVEEEPEEEVTEDPATGTEVDDSTDWVLHIPPNPVWLEEHRAVLAFRDNCCQNSEDEEALKQMWNQLVGDGCNANRYGICAGMGAGDMHAMNSRRACPKGWSLARDSSYDSQYDYKMCSHPDHIDYIYDKAYYPPEEANPQGVRRDHWDSNTG